MMLVLLGYPKHVFAVILDRICANERSRQNLWYSPVVDCSNCGGGWITRNPRVVEKTRMHWRLSILLAVLASGGTGLRPAAEAGGTKPFDVLIAHGHIIDGTGSPWYSGDVG